MDKQSLIAALEAPMEFYYREQSVNGFGANLVAYIDARDAARRLDEVFGPGGWTSEYFTRPMTVTQVLDPNVWPPVKEKKVVQQVFCRVGAKIDGEWVYKEDVGTESNTEAEKGLASDAFKRACVMWGIGRFLYTLGEMSLPSAKKLNWKGEVEERKGKPVYAPSVKKNDSSTNLTNKAALNAFANLVYKLGLERAQKMWLSTDDADTRLGFPKLLVAREKAESAQAYMAQLFGDEETTKLLTAYLPKGADKSGLAAVTRYLETVDKLTLVKQAQLLSGVFNADDLALLRDRLQARFGTADLATLTEVSSTNPILKASLTELQRIFSK